MYRPNDDILQKYADLLIKFALGSGEGIKHGETVMFMVPLSATEFVPFLKKSTLQTGGHPVFAIALSDLQDKHHFDNAGDHHLDFFPESYYKGMVECADHWVRILSEEDKYALSHVPSENLMKVQKAYKPLMDWRFEKERAGKMTWTLASYPTEHEAVEAGMTHEEYWAQILKACYLEEADPVTAWKDIFAEQTRVKAILDAMEIQKVHVVSEDIDLWVQLGSNRKWLGGSGRNIPSFELFITPDWRGTQGYIGFDAPLYRFGKEITDIRFEFVDGVITKASASKNEDLLLQMIAVENADKIGEFSLTDKRLSKIDRFMGQTLYDENFGGEHGNTHIAVGFGYPDSYRGDVASLTREELDDLGFNNSAIHTDIFSTKPRVVTAILPDGSERVIYRDGMFTV